MVCKYCGSTNIIPKWDNAKRQYYPSCLNCGWYEEIEEKFPEYEKVQRGDGWVYICEECKEILISNNASKKVCDSPYCKKKHSKKIQNDFREKNKEWRNKYQRQLRLKKKESLYDNIIQISDKATS